MKSLAVKYRPATFGEVVEQSSVVEILEYQLLTNTHKNAYLFTGGAGTGKTTCARIFANGLNKGVGAPIEIDAASNNGVEDVRNIRADAGFKAVGSEYKIYIIDECHMLSTGAWNAMLKLLEEPPAKTIFIMCTTDPHKIPGTILSRVQRYDFRRIGFDGIVDRLEYILQRENEEGCNYTAPPEGVKYIAKIADGGMRDAITMLDKATSYSKHLSLENIVAALGTVDYDIMFDLTRACCQGKPDQVMHILENLHNEGVDLKQFVRHFLEFILDLCKWNLCQDFAFIKIPDFYEEHLSAIPVESYDFIQEMVLDAILKLNNNIKWDSSPKALIQATFFLLCTLDEAEGDSAE